LSIKNSIIFLNKISNTFPMMRKIGKSLQKTLANGLLTEERDDLKVMANSYLPILRSTEVRWIAEKDFHSDKVLNLAETGEIVESLKKRVAAEPVSEVKEASPKRSFSSRESMPHNNALYESNRVRSLEARNIDRSDRDSHGRSERTDRSDRDLRDRNDRDPRDREPRDKQVFREKEATPSAVKSEKGRVIELSKNNSFNHRSDYTDRVVISRDDQGSRSSSEKARFFRSKDQDRLGGDVKIDREQRESSRDLRGDPRDWDRERERERSKRDNNPWDDDKRYKSDRYSSGSTRW
jgi:hypothetical protein